MTYLTFSFFEIKVFSAPGRRPVASEMLHRIPEAYWINDRRNYRPQQNAKNGRADHKPGLTYVFKTTLLPKPILRKGNFQSTILRPTRIYGISITVYHFPAGHILLFMMVGPDWEVIFRISGRSGEIRFHSFGSCVLTPPHAISSMLRTGFAFVRVWRPFFFSSKWRDGRRYTYFMSCSVWSGTIRLNFDDSYDRRLTPCILPMSCDKLTHRCYQIKQTSEGMVHLWCWAVLG